MSDRMNWKTTMCLCMMTSIIAVLCTSTLVERLEKEQLERQLEALESKYQFVLSAIHAVPSCYSVSCVGGGNCEGGLVGPYYNGVLENCYSTGSVKNSIEWK